MVLAAGRGERFWPLTENRPKHLLPVGGTPVLERTLRSLSRAGIRDVVLVVGFRAERIREKFGDGRNVGCRITYVRQERIRGTADALNASRDQLEGEDQFITTYGDDYYQDEAMKRFVKKAARSEDMMMASAHVEDTSRFGSLSLKKGFVHSVNEKPDTKGSGRVNAGIYLLGNLIFSAIKKTRISVRGERELTNSLEILLRQGHKVKSFPLTEGEWVGLSYPWDLLEANMRAMTQLGSSVAGEVESSTVLKGPVVIAKGALVKSGSYIEGPVLVAEGSEVGPNSYLRFHTALGKNVRVGAGCEVKNSIVMDNTRVPHLSYVGDSVIGEHCSLGAGTITANLRFDEGSVKMRVGGRLLDSRHRKLGAVLGDNVRTGINVSLLPGVRLGGGSWVGPGSTVRADLPSETRFKG